MRRTKDFILLGILISLEIVLTRFTSIPIVLFGSFTDRINPAGFLPIAVAGMLFGIPGGGIVAGVADIIRAIIFPFGGGFNPLYTVNAVLRGVTYGAVLGKKISLIRVIVASFIILVLMNTLLLCLIISFTSGNPFSVVLVSRLPFALINFGVQVVMISAIGIPVGRELYVRK